MNKKSQKRYYQEVNLLSFNNKDLVMDTWTSLKNLEHLDLVDVPSKDINSDESDDTKQIVVNKIIPTQYESYDSELSESDDENETNSVDNTDSNHVEIKIKNQTYIMEGVNLFKISVKGKKGDYIDVYSNGIIKKS
jgi:hypothetical protein